MDSKQKTTKEAIDKAKRRGVAAGGISGALIGAGIGWFAGPVGAVIGGAVGGAVGSVTVERWHTRYKGKPAPTEQP